MIQIAAIAGCIAAVLLAIAVIVGALFVKRIWGDASDARTNELNAYKSQVSAENRATAATARATTAEDVARKAIAALKVYEAKPSTPETDNATSDPDTTVSHRADALERLLNVP